MNDEEIKKALEDFYHRAENTNLSYHIFESEREALKDALTLINRQQAEVEQFKSLCTSKDVIINEQEAEIERLQSLCASKDVIIKAQEAEIDDLKHEIRNLECEKGQLEGTIDFLVAEAKSEAIKEFAAKLKCGVSITSGVITCADIDNLLAEMVGEQDA